LPYPVRILLFLNTSSYPAVVISPRGFHTIPEEAINSLGLLREDITTCQMGMRQMKAKNIMKP